MWRQKRRKGSQTLGDEEAGAAAWQRSRRKGPECRGGGCGAAEAVSVGAAARSESDGWAGAGLVLDMGRAQPIPDPLQNKLKLLSACFKIRANFMKRSTEQNSCIKSRIQIWPSRNM